MDEDNDIDIYYKAYMPDHKHYFVIVCMQWFDENGYDNHRFLTEEGEILQWKSEEEAEKFLIDNIKSEYVDPEILIKYREDIFYKEK